MRSASCRCGSRRARAPRGRKSAGATASARCRCSRPSASAAPQVALRVPRSTSPGAPWIDMRGIALALLLAAVIAVSIRWNSFVAGGFDSYCYVSQAERWATGRLHVVEPLALEAPWPDAPRTFTPIGHIPSPTSPGAIAPVCPAGLSLAMAPLVMIGGPRAAFAVIPLFGALLVL